MMRTRIVAVSYLNTIPFIHGIEHAGIDLHADLMLSPPSLCATALNQEQADVALIPVAAIPTIPNIRIITSFCIGASRSVRTVELLSNDPLEQLETICLDSQSLTSVRLVRILASELWNIHPQWRHLTDYSELSHPQPRTGYLIIGDKVFAHEGRFRYQYDLADHWRSLTGLPFVFAAWVAHQQVPEDFISSLESALQFGINHIPDAIATYGHQKTPYALDYLTHNIDFVFDQQKHRAMHLYWEMGLKIDPPINPG